MGASVQDMAHLVVRLIASYLSTVMGQPDVRKVVEDGQVYASLDANKKRPVFLEEKVLATSEWSRLLRVTQQNGPQLLQRRFYVSVHKTGNPNVFHLPPAYLLEVAWAVGSTWNEGSLPGVGLSVKAVRMLRRAMACSDILVVEVDYVLTSIQDMVAYLHCLDSTQHPLDSLRSYRELLQLSAENSHLLHLQQHVRSMPLISAAPRLRRPWLDNDELLGELAPLFAHRLSGRQCTEGIATAQLDDPSGNDTSGNDTGSEVVLSQQQESDNTPRQRDMEHHHTAFIPAVFETTNRAPLICTEKPKAKPQQALDLAAQVAHKSPTSRIELAAFGNDTGSEVVLSQQQESDNTSHQRDMKPPRTATTSAVPETAEKPKAKPKHALELAAQVVPNPRMSPIQLAAQVAPKPAVQPAAAPGSKAPRAPLIMAHVPKPARQQQQQQAVRKIKGTAASVQNESAAMAKVKGPSTSKSKKKQRQEAAEKELEAAQKEARAAAHRAVAGGLRSQRPSGTSSSNTNSTSQAVPPSTVDTARRSDTGNSCSSGAGGCADMPASVLDERPGDLINGLIIQSNIGRCMSSCGAVQTELDAGFIAAGSPSSGMHSPAAGSGGVTSMDRLLSFEVVLDQGHQDSSTRKSTGGRFNVVLEGEGASRAWRVIKPETINHTSKPKTSHVKRTVLSVVEEDGTEQELAHSIEVTRLTDAVERLVQAGQTSGLISHCYLDASMLRSSCEGTEQGVGCSSSGSLSSGMNGLGTSMESLMSSEEAPEQDHQDSRSHNSSSNGDSQAAEDQQAAPSAQQETVVLHSEETVVGSLSVLDGGMSSGNLSADVDSELTASSGSLSGRSSMPGSSDSPTAAEPHYEAVSEGLMSLSCGQLSVQEEYAHGHERGVSNDFTVSSNVSMDEYLQDPTDTGHSYLISSSDLAVDEQRVASIFQPINRSLVILLPTVAAYVQQEEHAPAQSPISSSEVDDEHAVVFQAPAVHSTLALTRFSAATDQASVRHEFESASRPAPAQNEPQQPAPEQDEPIQYEQPATEQDEPIQYEQPATEQDEPRQLAAAIHHEQPADGLQQHAGSNQGQQSGYESAAAVDLRQQLQSRDQLGPSHSLHLDDVWVPEPHSPALVDALLGLTSHPILELVSDQLQSVGSSASGQQATRGWVGRAAGFARRLLGGRKA